MIEMNSACAPEDKTKFIMLTGSSAFSFEPSGKSHITSIANGIEEKQKWKIFNKMYRKRFPTYLTVAFKWNYSGNV